jgi:hypothetical protein
MQLAVAYCHYLDIAKCIHRCNRRRTAVKPPQANRHWTVAKGVSTALQRQIDDWVDRHFDASGGFLGFGHTSAVDHVRAALSDG